MGISSAWVAVSIVSVSSTFVAVALLNQEVGFSAVLNGLVIGGAVCGIWAVKPLVRRIGKKQTLQLAMVWSGISLLLVAVTSMWFDLSISLWLILLPLCSVGLGPFFILPNAMLPDAIEEDGERGKSNQAVYFGSRGLFAEIAVATGILLVGLLLTAGKSADSPLGVQLSLLAASLFALGSAAFFTAYPIRE